MKRFFALLFFLCVALAPAHAQGPDEQYVRVYQLIQEADRLNELGQSRAAAAKYVEAQDALTRFRGIYPGWNDRVINYRLSYVATKLAPLAAVLTGGGVAASTNTMAAVVKATNAATVTPVSAEFDSQIKALQGDVERLQSDNRLLAAKLKEALSVQPAALDPRELARAEERIRALQKENELYRAKAAQKSSLPVAAPAPATPEMTARLNEQKEIIDTLRTENGVLKKQVDEWRQKYDATAAIASAAKAQTAAGSGERDAEVRNLRSENTELQKQVELWKQVARNAPHPPPATPAPAPATSIENRTALEALRARLQVLEAQPVPYTTEELALFEKPVANLVAGVATSALTSPPQPGAVPPAEGTLQKVNRGVPPGAGELVRTAERAFGAGRYAEAEKTYLEIVRQDESNVTMVGNLASAQLEAGQVAESEKNVMRALQLDPNDYFALYLLGRIRFRQERMDDAFEALSRSAKANPEYADTQNYLGIVLSEKGQRGPAEAALRRAVQLQPDNAVAHNNLAVVYATQKPPSLALARWHYKKALAAGHPKNAELEKLLGPVQ